MAMDRKSSMINGGVKIDHYIVMEVIIGTDSDLSHSRVLIAFWIGLCVE
jgi:hypothetical protein